MKVSFRKSTREIISNIREGDEKAMEKVYTQHRNDFVNWSIGKFGISEEDALDHYQDTMTIFFEKAMNLSLEDVGSSLKTYLFGIGKNRIRQQFDANSRDKRHEEGLHEHYRFLADSEEASQAYEEGGNQVKKMFELLGDSCKEILKLFYFEKRSMSEIAGILGHKSEGVSRTTKKRCLEKLRSAVKKPLTDG